MAREKELDFILSQNYNPEDDSPLKFRQRYSLLAKHRDELRKKCDAKERKRADILQAESQCLGKHPPPRSSELTNL